MLFRPVAPVTLPVRGLLSLSTSLAAIALTGVVLNAAGLPLTGVTLAAGALVVTLAAAPLLRSTLSPGRSRVGVDSRSETAVEPREGEGVARIRLAPRDVWNGLACGLAALAFIGALWWGATWIHLVNTGPYLTISYAGSLQQLQGPRKVQPGQTLFIPVTLSTSSGATWHGALGISVDGAPRVSERVITKSGATVRLRLVAPRLPGLHHASVSARGTEAPKGIALTLVLRVVRPHA